MMNYIKSECYRVLRDKGIYAFTAILAVLSFLLNFMLDWFGNMEGAGFRYDTTSFSYSNLVANPMVFCVMGTVVGSILYEGNRKNGNLKNTIAFGISRTKVFAGACIVASVTAIISLIVVLAVYMLSAILFLEHTGPVNWTDLMAEIPAVFLLAAASLISGIVCLEALGKNTAAICVWFMIWFVIPKIFFYIGLRIDIFQSIAMWMPENFFGTSGMKVNMSDCITAWETAEGMAKCIISGMIGIIVFSLSGVLSLRKREL